jgi:glycosyltransferase involved in cell wall biosynthesis
MRRVCIVTAAQLSMCPRALKAADALTGAGHRVRVVSPRFRGWSMDHALQPAWDWSVVDVAAPLAYLVSGARSRAARGLARLVGAERLPARLAAEAYGRVNAELVRAAAAEPADLVYGCTGMGMAVAAEAARRLRVPWAVDLEDFHSGEGGLDELAERIERDVLPGAAFATAGSAAIAAAYADKYGISPVPIDNVFPLSEKRLQPVAIFLGGLRCYWFSQTIGPGRGLETAVAALAQVPGAELHLLGRPAGNYLEELSGRGVPVIHHPPAPPDQMVARCRDFDVGLAVEELQPRNRALCLTNKAFAYLAAGLPIAFTDTPGQRALALDVGEAAFLAPPGDAAALAAGLRRWADDRDALLRASAAASTAFTRRWHWEHPDERGALVALFA